MPIKKSKSVAPATTGTVAKTALLGGEVFAIKLEKLGFCTGVVSRRPNDQTGLIHVYLRLEATTKPFSPGALGMPHTWPAAWIGMLTTKSIASGRWPIVGRLKEFDRAAFPIPPVRNESKIYDGPDSFEDVFSIETMPDEPSMSPLVNSPATREQAMRFPPMQIVIAGSRFEKSLVILLKKSVFSFHDVEIENVPVGKNDVAHWNKHASAARAKVDPGIARLLPAGGKTDRGAKAGDWFGFPMPGGGFGAAMMIERPDKHLRVFADSIMLTMRRRWDRWPTLDDVKDLHAEDGAMIRQLSLITVRDGRWRGLGAQPGFNKEDWPWPIPWYVEPSDEKRTLVRMRFSFSDTRYTRIPRKVLDLDPDAGRAISVMSGGDAIAADTYRTIENRSFKTANPAIYAERGVVTPKRIAAWKVINREVREAMKRAVKDSAEA